MKRAIDLLTRHPLTLNGFILLSCLACLSIASCQPTGERQFCDQTFTYSTEQPAYPEGDGPVVWIDEAHHNFHTLDGRYCGFAKVLEAHGYRLSANLQPFDQLACGPEDILVISNALDSETQQRTIGQQGWTLPNRSAFSTAEVDSLVAWVANGGHLFLIADHMPFPGCVQELASAFGFTFWNGYVEIDDRDNWPSLFSLSDTPFKDKGTLLTHPITAGIPSVVSFTGSAFRIPEKATPLLVLGADHRVILTEKSGRPYAPTAPEFSAQGWYQAAIMEWGKGKLIVCGEAAMFSAQTNKEGRKLGLHAPEAPHNPEFLLRLVNWLSN